MRYDAPFVVKRFAPMIGRPESPRRITIAYQAYTLSAAIEWCRQERTQEARTAGTGVWWHRPAVLFLERRGQSATRSRGPRAAGAQ
jgi:hypothetical protein